MNNQLLQPQFALGRIVATSAALEAIENSGQTPEFFLDCHAKGDWGNVCRGDRQANDEALASRTRLLSAYRTLKGCTIWIITEADRSVTTILLPSEY